MCRPTSSLTINAPHFIGMRGVFLTILKLFDAVLRQRSHEKRRNGGRRNLFAKSGSFTYCYACSNFSAPLFPRTCPHFAVNFLPKRLALRSSICCPTGGCRGVVPRPNGPVGRWRSNARRGPREPYDPTTLLSAQVQAGHVCPYRKLGRHAWTHAR